MRIGSTVVLIWIIIGAFATMQRGYLNSAKASCSHVATIAGTIAAGPLNYVGVNPRVKCVTPQPSR